MEPFYAFFSLFPIYLSLQLCFAVNLQECFVDHICMTDDSLHFLGELNLSNMLLYLLCPSIHAGGCFLF